MVMQGHDFLVFIVLKSALKSPEICSCHLNGNPAICLTRQGPDSKSTHVQQQRSGVMTVLGVCPGGRSDRSLLCNYHLSEFPGRPLW